MLKEKFKRAVAWCLSPDQMTQTWDRVFERAFGSHGKEDTEKYRNQIIRNQAARAVEWNWHRSPEEIRDFIEKETPPSGYLWNVTPDEIFTYSQQHFAELLPKRTAPQDQHALDALRSRLNASSPALEVG